MITFLFSHLLNPTGFQFLSISPPRPLSYATALHVILLPYSMLLLLLVGQRLWLPSTLGHWSGSLARLPVSLSLLPSVPFTHHQLNCPHLHLIFIPTLRPNTALLQIIVCSFISAFDHLLLWNLLFMLINTMLAPFLLNAKLTKNPGSLIRVVDVYGN